MQGKQHGEIVWARQRGEGVVSRAALDAMGLTRRQQQRLLATGDVTRIRHGWYAFRQHDEAIAAAVAIGGRLTCTSVLERHGVWMPVRSEVHARIASGARRHATEGVTLHRFGDTALGDDSVDDVETALRCAFHCLEPVDALIVADSVVNRRILSARAVHRVAGTAPKRTRRLLRALDGRSQSGTETIVRNALRRSGYRFVPQATVPGVGDVDLLVGDRLIIECDSTAFHTRDEHHAEDRRRDLNAVARGYLVVRLTFRQVRHNWPTTWMLLERVLMQGCHRWAPRERRLAVTAEAEANEVAAWYDEPDLTAGQLEALLASDPLA